MTCRALPCGSRGRGIDRNDSGRTRLQETEGRGRETFRLSRVFTLCHEADIHLKTGDMGVANRVARSWTDGGLLVYESTGGGSGFQCT
jgi:hypothetical protein